jgi:hypothetical protein
MSIKWGVLWHERNRLDGYQEHLVHVGCLPVLFRTRREAREWIERTFSYIKHRPDLRGEPHGWRLPMAVRVKIEQTKEQA